VTEEAVAQLLARAIQMVRERRREEARQLLLQVVERDEHNEQAWLWLSGVVDDPRDMQVALANALTINPRNEPARKGLDMLRQRYGDLLQAEEQAAAAPAPATVPTEEEEQEEIYAFNCYSCGAELYSVAGFCWQCHAAVHCCENCVRRRETACKEQRGIRGRAAATINDCPEWQPRV
jgi:hypothetical protein